MKILQIAVLLLITTPIIAQNNFKPGYYTTKSGDTISGLIKNAGWKGNPTSIEFKASENGERKTILAKNMTGFEITNEATFVYKTILLDVSTDNLNNLTFSKVPVYETRTAMIRKLVSGTATLFYYEKEGIKEFFYSKGAVALEPLVYVRYLADDQVSSNAKYKQQLLNAFADCASLEQQDFVNLTYARNSLIKIFDRYNSCSDSNYATSSNYTPNTTFNINVFAGANFASIDLTNTVAPNNGGDFGSQTNLRYGVELEAILPFNNSSWALYTGFAKNTAFESTIVQELSSTNTPEQDVTLTYSSINIPLGVRYYIPAGDDIRISLNAAYMFDVVNEVSLKREFTANDFENAKGTQGLFVVGAGFHYKRFFARANLDISKDPFNANSEFYEADLSSLNLVLGYQIPLGKK